MLYLPVPLLIHLHDHNIKMPEFDRKFEEWFTTCNYADRPETLMALFFGTYLRTPVPQSPEILEFFKKLKDIASKTLDVPVYLMPPEFVYDIRYDKMREELISTPVEWSKVFKPPSIRPGQLDLLTKLVASKSRVKIVVAPTGIGKTWTVLAYARASGKKTIMIEPEKGMETQLEQKYDVPIIMGMQHYMCMSERKPASESGCRVLGKDSPCGPGCQWYDKVDSIRRELFQGNPVATNPGNFWKWIKHAELVIVDEFHKVFSQLTNSHMIPDDVSDETGMDWLASQIAELSQAEEAMYFQLRSMIKTGAYVDRKLWDEYNDIQNTLAWMDLFLKNYDHVYIYSQGDTRYMKLDKEGTVNYFTTLYPDKEIVFVSATPFRVKGAETITTDKSVISKLNAPIIYYPVANLSSASVSENPDYLRLASAVIMDMYNHFKDNRTTQKIIVHSGNTGKHGSAVSDYLREHGLKVMQHTRGKLMETIETFRNENYDALVVASADAGYDFYGDVFGLQFILKVPYPTLGEEWVAIENKHGKSYRWDLYANETITQIVQASGRICRGADDVGITMILDEKFAHLYNANISKFPDSFKERLYDISGKLRNTAPSWQLDHYEGDGNETAVR